jgi:hypothetical protein
MWILKIPAKVNKNPWFFNVWKNFEKIQFKESRLGW